MKNLIKLKNTHSVDFSIKWRLTDVCNLDCSYCVRKKKTQSLDDIFLETEQKYLENIALRIDKMLERLSVQSVQLDIIGGEVTIFDLEKIFCNMNSKKIKEINITTNFMRNAQYFISFANMLKEKDIRLSLTASYHFEYQSFDDYFNKVELVRNHCYSFNCEMVSLTSNQELANKFLKKCNELNVDFKLEADIRNFEFDKEVKVLYKGRNKKPRYIAEFSDGTKVEYSTRNAFLKDTDIEENRFQKGICTKGFYCTSSYNYIYIARDIIYGRTKDNKDCSNLIKIEDFEIIEPCKCIAKCTFCTLCGNMDIYKNI